VSKQFWTFLLIGLAVVGVGIGAILFSTRGNHLELKGEILKVRVLALNDKASIVVLDFRVTNPSDIPFVVKTATITLDPASGEALEGATISKRDLDNVFKYEKLLGPKYNDVLTIRDRVDAHQKMDRMVAARVELPESGIQVRKAIHLRIEDLDGAVAELAEKKGLGSR
jgi:hypothetical protein